MKTFFSIISLCMIVFAQKTFSTEAPITSLERPGNIQVLIEKNVPKALLEAKGGYLIFDPKDGSKISSGISGKRFFVEASTTGIRWGEDFPGQYQLCILPKSSESALFVNGIQYAGAIAIFKVGNKLNIINEVDIENYLKATLASHFPYPLENETMAAIAIAARTTAYFQSHQNPNSFWHVDAKTVGYQGCALALPDSSISHAIDATRHLILLCTKDGKNIPFAACWNEHCAGKTAPFHVVFRKDFFAPSKGVDSPQAFLDREKSKWSFTLPKKEASSLFGFKHLDAIELFVDSSSGKVYGTRLKGDHRSKDIDFISFQKKLGENRLLSNDFKVVVKNQELAFSGYGKGCGVGLCLYSASSMAQNGEIAVKILSKFFPETFLVNLSALSQEKKER